MKGAIVARSTYYEEGRNLFDFNYDMMGDASNPLDTSHRIEIAFSRAIKNILRQPGYSAVAMLKMSMGVLMAYDDLVNAFTENGSLS